MYFEHFCKVGMPVEDFWCWCGPKTEEITTKNWKGSICHQCFFNVFFLELKWNSCFVPCLTALFHLSSHVMAGSLELHHVALHIPGTASGIAFPAIRWGTTLARDPLEAGRDGMFSNWIPFSSRGNSTIWIKHDKAFWRDSTYRVGVFVFFSGVMIFTHIFGNYTV